MEILREYLKYDPESISGLVWIKLNKNSHAKLFNTAGGLDLSTSYWKLSFRGKRYKVHRVIWYLFHGEIDKGLVIDHIDGNPSNNKIENLRLVKNVVNSRNRAKNRNNSTGYTGVTYHEGFTRKGTPYSKFCACYYDNTYKKKQRTFSIQKYGYEEAFRLAREYREKMLEKLKSTGYGYSERHGK